MRVKDLKPDQEFRFATGYFENEEAIIDVPMKLIKSRIPFAGIIQVIVERLDVNEFATMTLPLSVRVNLFGDTN